MNFYPQNCEQVNTQNHNLLEAAQENNSTTRANTKVENLNCNRKLAKASVQISVKVKNFREFQSQRYPHFQGFYLQEIYQVLILNIREKSPHAFVRWRENVGMLKCTQSILFSSKKCPPENYITAALLTELRKRNTQFWLSLKKLHDKKIFKKQSLGQTKIHRGDKKKENR